MKFDEFDWGKLGVEATGIKFHFEKALPQYESLKFRNDLRNKSNHITDFIQDFLKYCKLDQNLESTKAIQFHNGKFRWGQ